MDRDSLIWHLRHNGRVKKKSPPRPYKSMLERIAANSVESDRLFYTDPKTGDKTPCRVWTGPRNGSGYGHIGVRRKRGPKKNTVAYLLVHRVVAELVTGIKPRSRVVKHLCNNYLCCEGGHLKIGTQKSNVQQCVKDGRHYSHWRDSKKLADERDGTSGQPPRRRATLAVSSIDEEGRTPDKPGYGGAPF